MKRLLALLFLLPLTAMASPACSVSATGLNFGSFSFLSAAGVSSQTQVAVTCDSTGIPATIGFADSSGYLQTTGAGVMTGAPSGSITFRLYQDPARTLPWGRDNGTAMSTTIPAHLTVYGSILCADNGCDNARPIPAGTYTDDIQVSVVF